MSGEIEPPPQPPPERPERFPFWGYAELATFWALFLVSAMLVPLVFRITPQSPASRVVPAQIVLYAILLGFLYFVIRIEYGRPFWRSLGWVRPLASLARFLILGLLVALLVGLLGAALRTPDINGPLKQLLSNPRAIVGIAALAITIGPLFEELAFRGFMQPLLVRSLGAVPGILLAAALFGALHLPEYGWSWRHFVLITFAGVTFGWVRHRTGSTLASTVMHAAYNGMFLIALLVQTGSGRRGF